MSARVLRTGRPARMDSYEHAPGVIAATVRGVGIRSSIGVPISVEGRPWGVMIATSKAASPFPAETESRLQDFTELVATAISNASARDKVRVLADEQAALRRVATLVAHGVLAGRGLRGDRARGRSSTRRGRHAHGPIRGRCGDQRRRLERGGRPPAGRHAGRTRRDQRRVARLPRAADRRGSTATARRPVRPPIGCATDERLLLCRRADRRRRSSLGADDRLSKARSHCRPTPNPGCWASPSSPRPRSRTARRARSSPPRAPAWWPPPTRSAGASCATSTTERSSGSCTPS